MPLLGRPEGSRGDYWGTYGQPWGPRTSKGGPLGGSCGPKGDFWGTLGSQGRPTLRPRDAKGEPRDAIGRPRRAKGGPREAKMAVKSTQAAPKWVQNGRGHGQNTKCKNIKKTRFFASKWIGNQPRTCQKRSQRVPGRPSGGTETTNGRPDDRSGHGRGPSGRSGGRPGPRAGPW